MGFTAYYKYKVTFFVTSANLSPTLSGKVANRFQPVSCLVRMLAEDRAYDNLND
jgi:hypothetical protein